MPETPEVAPLPYNHRVWFFRLLLLLFVALVPLFMFYATGYRVAWLEGAGNIVSVGGIFVSADASDIAMYINEEPVQNMRLFQQAAYIQNLPAGTHRLHVQGEGLHTWVKEIPVYPQLVTEAAAFNMPVVPQLRYIAEYRTATGTPVLLASSTSSQPVSFEAVAFTQDWVVLPPRTATTTLVENEEFDYLAQLFGTTSASTTQGTIINRIETEIDRFVFSSAATSTATTATSTRVVATNDQTLALLNGQLVVTWIGNDRDRPFYFCEQVATTSLAVDVATTTVEQCRTSIAIQETSVDTEYYNFFPDSDDLILLTRADGLYVQEIDDRGWQNAQRIYPHSDIQVVLDGGRIFIADAGYYFELIPTLIPS